MFVALQPTQRWNIQRHQTHLTANTAIPKRSTKTPKTNVCVYDYKTLYGQVLQRRSHTGLKPFKCDVCPTSFALKQTLDRHLRTHFGESPSNARNAISRSRNLGNLPKHEKTHSPKESKCSECPKKFTLPETLSRHMQLHVGTTPTCERCGHKTQTREAMNGHKRHSKCAGEPKHKCEHCKYSTQDGAL